MIIYKAINIINGKVYVGKTIQSLIKRKNKHKSNSLNNSKTYFHRAIQKYKFKNFKWEIIDKANNIDELNKKEIYWINFYNSTNSSHGYNLTKGGDGIIGLIFTDEHKKKISKSLKGHKHTEESKKKMSKSKKGKRLGIKPSLETRLKISKANTGKKHSKETCKKLSIINLGKKHSDETKEKISKNNKNSRKVINLDTGIRFNTIKNAISFYKIKSDHIGPVCLGKRKTCGGYRWAYV